MSSPFGYLLGSEPAPRRFGALVAIAGVALSTALVYPLELVAPAASLIVVYVPVVLVVSAIWGASMGAATAVLSALALNFFHLPPTGRLTIRNPENWVALSAFLVVAWFVSSVARMTRTRAREAIERRREADLAAEMARLLLRGNPLRVDLPAAAARLAQVLALPSVSIELGVLDAEKRHLAFPLRDGARRLGTLLVPAEAGEDKLRRLQERVVPALEALLSAALEREALIADAVENAALRRADVVKTALLRAVSHDLRSPLTAISTASEAIASSTLSEHERLEMTGIIQLEARRLARLVDHLLDLSRLEAGVAEPQMQWTAIDELIEAALEEIGAEQGEFALTLDPNLPLVRADPVQMERAFVNVLENARRYRAGHTVSVRARAVSRLAQAHRARGPRGEAAPRATVSEAPPALGAERMQASQGAVGRLVVRIVDRGPGIPPAQLERVFEPFYRAGTAQGGYRGSGLGLAIARGFTESNGGSLHAESLPGQGTSFVFELPLLEEAWEGESQPVLEPSQVTR